MKREHSMPSWEFNDYMALGALCSKCRDIAERTTDKPWRKWLKFCCSTLTKIIDERATYLDDKSLKSVENRVKHQRLILKDESMSEKQALERQKRFQDDLQDVAELAMEHCYSCELAGREKDQCKYRQAFHRLGIEINPGWIQCEFRG